MATAIVGTLLMIAGGPGFDAARSARAAWNFGHVPLFFLWTFLLLPPIYRQRPKRSLRLPFLVLLGTLIAGAIVEGIQHGFGRMPDAGDMAQNLIGCWLALAFFDPVIRAQPKPIRRAGILAALGLLTYALWPVAAAVCDEVIAYRQFPVLSSLETPLERSRWTGGERAEISHVHSLDGRHALKVRLTTRRYSGLALSHFPRNWTGFDSLWIGVYNPDAEPISLTCRIHDAAHDHRYEDRYNRKFFLRSGWNRITVDLDAVRRAPDGREMDLSRIMAVGLFSTRLPNPRQIYIDDVRLAKEPQRNSPTMPQRR